MYPNFHRPFGINRRSSIWFLPTQVFQYVHMDHQGSVAKVTDANQNVQISYVRDAFGRQIVAPGGSNPNVPNDLVFQSNWITANVGTIVMASRSCWRRIA